VYVIVTVCVFSSGDKSSIQLKVNLSFAFDSLSESEVVMADYGLLSKSLKSVTTISFLYLQNVGSINGLGGV
jgi:hypothetical protein